MSSPLAEQAVADLESITTLHLSVMINGGDLWADRFDAADWLYHNVDASIGAVTQWWRDLMLTMTVPTRWRLRAAQALHDTADALAVRP